jgi:hypothetical protein
MPIGRVHPATNGTLADAFQDNRAIPFVGCTAGREQD